MNAVHVHQPGPEVESDSEAAYADCIGCGVRLWTYWHDYDGDGVGHWTSWRPAPRRVVVP